MGLDKGDIPLSPSEGANGVCLTKIVSLTNQSWVHLIPRKLGIRLTVEIDAQDPRLKKWKYVPDLLRMERTWWKQLTRVGEGDPYKWWLFFGVIVPSQITEFLDTETRRCLTDADIHIIKSEPPMRGSMKMTGTKVLTFDEALREPMAA